MSQPVEDKLNTVSEERLNLLRENNILRKSVEAFQKKEEELTSLNKKLESQVDSLEQEKYRLMEETSSLKCDVNIKETEIKRITARMEQIRSTCLALEEKYTKQKEKLQGVMNSEKEFYKGLQDVIDYYYDCLQKYSKFSTKMLIKLMVNEPVSISQELKDDFASKYSGLKILNGSIDIPSVKVNKKSLFRNLQQRVAFFQDIEFDKTQIAFDKLLEELKNKGVTLEIGDMNLLLDSKASSRPMKKVGSTLDDTSILNESLGDVNANTTMFLSDLDKSENILLNTTAASSRAGGYTNLGDHLAAIKNQIKAKLDETSSPDYESINKVLKNVNDLVDFINQNVDMGQSDKAKGYGGQTPRVIGSTPRNGGGFGGQLDNILDDIEPAATPQVMRELVSRVKDKIAKLKENASVRTEDLVTLEKLVDQKDKANFDWNKLEIFQQRLNKKINFLAEFIKDKEATLQDKKVYLEKSKAILSELEDSVKALNKELRDVEDERRDVDGDLAQKRREKQTLAAKIELCKREINRIRATLSTEDVKIATYTEDLEMFTNERQMQEERKIKLEEESDKLQKKVESFTNERRANQESMFRQKIDELLLNERKTLMSSVTRGQDNTQQNKGASGMVFFSLRDLHGNISSSEQLPKVKEILEKKIDQILSAIDQIESKESAKDIISKNQESILQSVTFGPHFILFYRTLLLLFHICLRLLDKDESCIGLLKTLNETLLKTQMFEGKIKSWDSISQMRHKVLEFQLEIKESLGNMMTK